MGEMYTKTGIEIMLKGLAPKFEQLAHQIDEIELPQFEQVYLVGAGTGHAAALSVKNAFAHIEGLTGEKIHVVTPAHFQLSIKDEDKKNALIVLLGDCGQACERLDQREAVVRIPSDGDLEPAEDSLLGEYLQMAAACLLLAARCGRREGELAALKDAVGRSIELLESWDDAAMQAAPRIRGLVDAYETVGTGGDYAAAWLTRSMIYQCGEGGTVTVEESEDWLHVNFLQLTPERFATFVFLSAENEAADRTLRTIRYIEGVGRRTVIFTDIPPEEFSEESCLICLSGLDQDILPVFMPIPAALLLGHLKQ